MAHATIIKYDEFIDPSDPTLAAQHTGALKPGHQWTIEVDGKMIHEWQDVLVHGNTYATVDWGSHKPR
jgi:hypothetical protein